MQATPMTHSELLVLILGVAAVVAIVCVTGFVFFRKFLNKEATKAEMFRSVHRDESQSGS
jgi:hypothetical protein